MNEGCLSREQDIIAGETIGAEEFKEIFGAASRELDRVDPGIPDHSRIAAGNGAVLARCRGRIGFCLRLRLRCAGSEQQQGKGQERAGANVAKCIQWSKLCFHGLGFLERQNPLTSQRDNVCQVEKHSEEEKKL